MLSQLGEILISPFVAMKFGHNSQGWEFSQWVKIFELDKEAQYPISMLL